MKENDLLGNCPVCNFSLTVTELSCSKCKTKINGNFKMSPFEKLNDEQMKFTLIFIKNEGNIKKIEEELNISYPTVKNKIKELKLILGFKEKERKIDKAKILDQISKGEIAPEDAIKLLK